jgi:hypothetical protein
LEVDPVRFDPFGMPAEVDRRLREDFCTDVLAVCADEFRLRRGAMLRWARGWDTQHGITDVPPAVAQLPEVSPYG